MNTETLSQLVRMCRSGRVSAVLRRRMPGVVSCRARPARSGVLAGAVIGALACGSLAAPASLNAVPQSCPTATVSTVAELRAATALACVRTIRIEPGTYLLTDSGSGPLAPTSVKTFVNAGGGRVTIDAGGASRVFVIPSGVIVQIIDLEITGGATTGADDGGGLLVEGELLMLRSLVYGNASADDGGGLFQATGATILIENSTFHANTADDRGAGMSIRTGATLNHVTVANNTAGGQGAGLERSGPGSGPLLTNVLVADNTGRAGQIRGAMEVDGVNLVEGGCSSCRPGTDLRADPVLQPLADNGGLTRTLALGAGSPAIDTATNILPTDQRGVARPIGPKSDIGAFEGVAVAAAVDVLSSVSGLPRLPSNGTAYELVFVVNNEGGTSATYDLIATATSPTVVIDSIRGAGLTFDPARPDSARSGAVAGGDGVVLSVWYRVGDVAAGESSPVTLTATDVASPVVQDSDETIITVVRPQLGISKTAVVAGDTVPGSLLTYQVTVTNLGSEAADTVRVGDVVPDEVAYQVGSATETLPAGVSAVVEFADALGTFGYSPVSGGCGAPSGFDACVRFVRWRILDPLPDTPGSNVGQFTFTSIIR